MSEERDHAKHQIGKLGRAKEWLLPKLAWFICGLFFLGFLFKTLRWPGASAGIVFGNFFFIAFFVPLYFFSKRKISNPKIPCWVSIFQGVFFVFIAYGVMAKIQHYPWANISISIGNGGLTLIIIWLVNQGKRFKIKKPIFLGLLVSVAFLTLNQFTMEIIESDYKLSGIRQTTVELQKRNDSLAFELNRYNDFSSISNFISYVDSIETNLIESVEQIPYVVADTISYSSIQALDHYDTPTNLLIGPDSQNPSENKQSAIALLKQLKQVLATGIVSEVFLENELIKKSEAKNEKEYVLKHFYHQPLGLILLKMETYKSILLESFFLKKQRENGQVSESDFIKASKLNSRLIKYNFNAQSTNLGKRVIFFGMFTFSFFLSIIFFFIPTFKISDKWKMRLILFSIVILFEFLLLVIDTYTGLLSNNLLSVLLVNIVLAFLLVGADNYVRINMLAWYKDEE